MNKIGKRRTHTPEASRSPYEVGYGKPPESTRFKPGQSGNPRGRPSGRKNKRPAWHEERLKDLFVEEAYRDIKINEGNRVVRMPMAKAIMRSLNVAALKGNPRAQRLFIDRLTTIENENKKLNDEWVSTALDYKLGWERVFANYDARGLPRPTPPLNPDHIEIDMNNGTAVLRSPSSQQENAAEDELAIREDCDEAIER